MKRIDTTAEKRSFLAKVLPKREMQSFGAIQIYPRQITFETQNRGERIYLLVRAHVVTNIGWIIKIAIWSILPIFMFIFLDYFSVGVGLLPATGIILLIFTYYLIVIVSALMSLLSWYYNIYLVTSERILHYQFKPLSTYKISEAEIENIQDISQSTIGFLPNMFEYGDVLVQTAATRNKFHFKDVPKPVWFRNVIADLSTLVRTSEP